MWSYFPRVSLYHRLPVGSRIGNCDKHGDCKMRTPRHSADNKDYTDYTGLQGAAVLLLLLLHRMTESIYYIATEQICREFAMLWETHCVTCVNMHLMCNLHYFMCNSSCILRRAVRIPRDPTAVTLSGCDDRWTRVELDPTPADTLFLVSDNSDGKSWPAFQHNCDKM